MKPGAYQEIANTGITSKKELRPYVPNDEELPMPLKFFDVTRRTNTTLDVLLQSRSDNYLNIDGERELSAPWTCFHPIHVAEREAT